MPIRLWRSTAGFAPSVSNGWILGLPNGCIEAAVDLNGNNNRRRCYHEPIQVGEPGVPSSKKKNQPSFETTLAELETLVEQLESGELELADSLEKFKRGIELSKQCRAVLDEAQQTIDEVMASDALPDSGDQQSPET